MTAALDAVYGTKGQLSQLWVLAREKAFGDRYQRFMKLEREATVQYQYVCSVIPGLLQTEATPRRAWPRAAHAMMWNRPSRSRRG